MSSPISKCGLVPHSCDSDIRFTLESLVQFHLQILMMPSHLSDVILALLISDTACSEEKTSVRTGFQDYDPYTGRCTRSCDESEELTLVISVTVEMCFVLDVLADQQLHPETVLGSMGVIFSMNETMEASSSSGRSCF